jgi:hypothetical protein
MPVQTIKLPGFASGSYRSEAIYADVQRCVNFYPERVESDTGEASIVLYRTPGTLRFGVNPGTSASGPARGMIEVNNQVFIVIGNDFYELVADGSFTFIDNVANDGQPVSMAANNVGQIFIASANQGYCYGIPEQINIPAPGPTPPTPSGFRHIVSDGVSFFGASQVTFLDDYFIVLTPHSSQIQVSALNDGTTWNGIAGVNVAVLEGQADHLACIIADKEFLYILGTRRSELWESTGTSFPFAINPGSFMEIGCVAPATLAQADNAIIWLGQDARGSLVFYRADGFRPTRISTHATEFAWQQYGTVSDARVFVYQQNGHTFAVLTFPTADATWVYDFATRLWHERSFTDLNGNAHQTVAAFHCFAFNQHLVQSCQAVPGENQGQVYVLSIKARADLIDTNNPTGTVIVRDRITPHIYEENKWYFCNYVELRVMNGIGLDGNPPIGMDPKVMLKISRDGGNTWGQEDWRSAGAIGNYMKRLRWNLLGAWRDGVLWFRVTDPVDWVFIDCYICGELGA